MNDNDIQLIFRVYNSFFLVLIIDLGMISGIVFLNWTYRITGYKPSDGWSLDHFGIAGDSARTFWVNTSKKVLEFTTVDGRNIQTLLSGTTPSPPKFNVIVTWSALAPMDEKNQTPNITFANTRAETLRFGGAGVQHSACCRVWIFCSSTVSFSDVFTTFGLQTLLWKHQCACCWSSSKLRKTLAFHK